MADERSNTNGRAGALEVASRYRQIMRGATTDAALAGLSAAVSAHEALVQSLVQQLEGSAHPAAARLVAELRNVNVGCLGSACLRIREEMGEVDESVTRAVADLYDALAGRADLTDLGSCHGRLVNAALQVEEAARVLSPLRAFWFRWENDPTWLLRASAILNMAPDDRDEGGAEWDDNYLFRRAILIQSFHAERALGATFSPFLKIALALGFFCEHRAFALELIDNQLDGLTPEAAEFLCRAVREVLEDHPTVDCITRYIHEAAPLLRMARAADERLARGTTEFPSVIEALLAPAHIEPEESLDGDRLPWAVRPSPPDGSCSWPDSGSVIELLLLLHAHGYRAALPQARELCDRWLTSLPIDDVDGRGTIVALGASVREPEPSV